MLRFGTALTVLLLAGCDGRSPAQKFEAMCREQASEMVIASSATGVLAFNHWVEGAWTADPRDIPTAFYDARYAPVPLAQALLKGPDRLSGIHFTYRLEPIRGAKGRCRALYQLDATSADQVHPDLDCSNPANVVPERSWEKPRPWVYSLREEVGAVDADGIRPFTLTLTDGRNPDLGIVLAQQRSFQLLPSPVSARQRVPNGGLEPVAGVRSCDLTPPDVLIKQAFQPWSPATGWHRPATTRGIP